MDRVSKHGGLRLVLVCALLWASVVVVASPQTQTTAEPFEPTVGQPGKDVVWVPTPQSLVEKMLDLAQVTPQDFVVDLGSGDGRNVIAAAKRGARGLGVEYNPDMVALSRRNAAQEGVSDKAQFVEGDMFAAEFSEATVLALFLLPDNMRRLRPKFLELKPGTRIVANTFGFDDWEPDAQETLPGECGSWCNALLWIVPAQARGTWRLANGTLTLRQDYQKLYGTLRLGEREAPVENGRMRGDQITFTSAGVTYTGRVEGQGIEGTAASGGKTTSWSATKEN